MKKFSCFLFVAVLLGLFTFSCGSDSDDSGGVGAEFDESLYYTKTDVDKLLSDFKTELTQEIISGLAPAGSSGTDLDSTAITYNTGTSVDYVSGYSATLAQISINNGTSGETNFDVTVGTAADNNATYNLYVPENTYGNCLAMIYLPEDSKSTVSLKAWSKVAGTADVSITIIPLLYFTNQVVTSK
ncbi:MAG: hypothetical protein PF637_04815 [Spirochaetes bacterium]|jgi:hypothetical protein|nr:hypothetical protein [Spirochaetota bacterium]